MDTPQAATRDFSTPTARAAPKYGKDGLSRLSRFMPVKPGNPARLLAKSMSPVAAERGFAHRHVAGLSVDQEEGVFFPVEARTR
jgi:hypothetical protein